MTRDLNRVPVALLHALKHYKVLHERVVMMQVDTQDVPHVPDEQRLEIRELGKGFFTIRVRYGFMDEPNVLRALAQCRVGGFRFNLMETSFIIGREKLRLRPRVHAARFRFWRWRDRAFHPDVEQHARRDRVLPYSPKPCRRARRSSRDLTKNWPVRWSFRERAS